MSHWAVLFYGTLAKYLPAYVDAQGDIGARAQILKDCKDEITKSPMHEDNAVDLPRPLRLVSDC
jgi:hypothetical protein